MKRLVTFIYILILMPWKSFGIDLPGSRYIPVQAQGMGNAFLPLAEDNLGALFYQPSALAKKRKTTIDILNLQLEGNSDIYGDSSKVLSLSGMKLEKNSSQFPYSGMQGGLGFGFAGFSVGALYKQQLSATRNEDNVTYKTKYQLIPAFGFGLSLADGVMRVGYSFQWVHQKSTHRTTPYVDSGLEFTEGLDKGSAFSHNVGFTLTFPMVALPSFDLVLRNLNKATFVPFSAVPVAGSTSGNTPEHDPMSMDVAFSLQPKLQKNSKLFFVTQIQDLGSRSGTSLVRRLAIGTQWELGSTLRLRAGVSEGYPTLGFGIHRKRTNFDLSWFSVERGSSFRQDQDERIALQFRWDID